MRILLTNSSEFMLSPDIIVCTSVDDVYVEVEKNGDTEDTLIIYVDSVFMDEGTLKQLELFRYEFNEFSIILGQAYKPSLEVLNLEISCYYITPVSNVATDLFIKAEKYEPGVLSVNSQLDDLRRGLDNKDLLKNLVEFDFTSLKTSINSILQREQILLTQNTELRQEVQTYMKEKNNLSNDVKVLKDRIKKIETNRRDLLSENLKLKYETYKDEVASSPTTSTTPLFYVKSIIPKEEEHIVKFFEILNNFLRNKYNINSTLLIIDDFNTLKMKKLRNNFSYVSSDGKYNVLHLGNNIITTSSYVKPLFENFEKFSGVKDVFIVLDLSCSVKSFVLGDGYYLLIINDLINESLYNNLAEVKKIHENEIVNCFVGEDDFNTELNVVNSPTLKEMEKIIIELV